MQELTYKIALFFLVGRLKSFIIQLILQINTLAVHKKQLSPAVCRFILDINVLYYD